MTTHQLPRLLITGESGFIGQHLLPKLQQGYNVRRLPCDLRDHTQVYTTVKEFDPEIVVHLAARTEVQKSFYEPTVFSDVNYTGTVNLIEACARSCTNLRSFVFASTMEVYGWQPISDEIRLTGRYSNQVAFDEHTEPNPNAPYAVAKRGCELYLEYAHRSMGFPFVALRQTNCYGRTDNDFFVTEQIITQMLSNPHEINLGYGDPYRNFIHIDDLISAWLSVIDNSSTLPSRIYTVGPDDPIRISDYVREIGDLIGWNGKVNWNTKPPRVGEIYWLNSSGDKLSRDTGWAPRVSRKDGLLRTIDIWKKKMADV